MRDCDYSVDKERGLRSKAFADLAFNRNANPLMQTYFYVPRITNCCELYSRKKESAQTSFFSFFGKKAKLKPGQYSARTGNIRTNYGVGYIVSAGDQPVEIILYKWIDRHKASIVYREIWPAHGVGGSYIDSGPGKFFAVLLCTDSSGKNCDASIEIHPVYKALGLKTNHPTAYQILGVNPNASRREIRDAYKALSLQWHPDKNQNNPLALEVFQAIVNARDYLLTD